MKTTSCPKCGRIFKTAKTESEDKPQCFYCHLEELTACADGSHIEPDQGDINTARWFSGTYTRRQWKNWDAQLALVEGGNLQTAVFPGNHERFDVT